MTTSGASKKNFAHLHVHSEYSLLDGSSRIRGLVERAYSLGQPAIAVTDHGSLSGAFTLWRECNSHGIKPIIGSEFYVAPNLSTLKDRVEWGRVEEEGTGRAVPGAYTHLTVLAQNSQGVRNLYKLQRDAYSQGFYYKPRIDRELLAKYSNGLIILSGCMGSEISTRLRLGQINEAEDTAAFFATKFPDRFFIEVMDHTTDEDRKLNNHLSALSKRLSIPMVATNDTHYTLPSDSVTHDALLCVQTRAKLSDEKRFRFSGEGYYLKSRAEMELLPLSSGALDNTLLIAEMVEDYSEVFTPGQNMPKGDIRELSQRAWDGFDKHGFWHDAHPVHWGRLNHELKIIDELGYTGYILVIADIVRWAKSQGIFVGPGRGSAGASLVAYCLGITSIDPIEHNLVFERFLNPSRVSPPDFDIDFQEDRRDEVIRYAAETFGEACVAQIQTYGTIGSRWAVKDAARVLGRSTSEGQKLANMVPGLVRGRQASLSEVPGIAKTDQEVYELALGLEGLIRSASKHAAGVVISETPLDDLIPVKQGEKDIVPVTAFENSELESLNLIKYDFLGLKQLTTIQNTLGMIDEIF